MLKISVKRSSLMFCFLSWFRNYSYCTIRISKAITGRRNISRPLGVEQLEDRLTPADAGGAVPLSATLVYQNGPLIPSVQIQPIFLQDTQTSQTSAYESQLDGFLKTITSDSYIPALLGPYSQPEYIIGNGSVGQDDVNVPITPIGNNDGIPVIDDSQIQTAIYGEIQANRVPPPNGNTLYFVFTPPGDEIYNNRTGGNSIQNFGGYHYYFTSANGSDIYYAVISYPGFPNPTVYPDTLFQQITVTATHEMAEAITDPTLHGWRTNVGSSPTIKEIGDLVNEESYTQDGYVVQYLWSNALQGPAQAQGETGANLVIDQITPPSATSFAGGQVAKFTDTDPTLNASSFVALVDFDDGHGRQFASVSGGVNGVYAVSATPASPLKAGAYGSPFSQDGMLVYVMVNQNGEAGRGGPLTYRYSPYIVESSPPSNPITEFFDEVNTAESRFLGSIGDDVEQLFNEVAAVTAAYTSQSNNLKGTGNATVEDQYMFLIAAAERRFYAAFIQSVDQLFIDLGSAEAQLASNLIH